ncbi:MAG TPA: glycosyltransferase family 9 protein [Gemmatimonadales bacterium]|nr:glycosyltransferase family 9 protein [Gemmatimonadales bacterium]
MAGRLKRIRQGIKRPLQTLFAGALVLPLDRRPRTVRDLDAIEPRAILVSRTDRIGDLLCCSPLVLALHRRWPGARIVLVSGPKNRSVLQGLPFVEQGPVFRRDPRSWAEIAWRLGRQSFDLYVSLRAESVAGAWIGAWSRAPIRMATHATYARPSSNLILGVDDYHQTTRYCRAAAALGQEPEAVRPVFLIPDDAERRAAELAATLLPADGRPVVGIQIPHRARKRYTVRAWPPEKVFALAQALTSDGCRVVLCGMGDERVEGEAIRARIPDAVVSPDAPLAVFAALQRRFAVFVSPFTGTLHLADAVGVPVVAYGLEDQVRGWGVLGPANRNVGAPRVADIPVETLLEAARAAVAGAARAGKGPMT